MPQSVIRAAAYIRLSDPKKQEKGFSKQFQERKIRDKCEEEGYSLRDDHIFYDGFRSTYWREREELQRMLVCARRHEIDMLILYDLDRLSREPKHQMAILEELEYLGIAIIILNEEQNHVNDGTFEGEVMTAVHGLVSKQEHKKRIRRSHDGVMERTEEQGALMPSYKPLYGYRFDDPGHKQKKKYVIYEPEAKIVRRIFKWKLHGVTIAQICISLNKEGIPTPKGGAVWKHQVVADVLKHPAYKGEAYAMRWKHTFVPGRKSMKQELRPEDEWIKLPDGTIPPLVSKADWDMVQRELQWNKEQAARRNKYPEAALARAGVAKCGVCGANMTFKKLSNPDHGGHHHYRCIRQSQIGNTCKNSVISVKKVDDAVWHKCLELLADPQIVEQALRAQYQDDPNKPSRESLERAILSRGRKIQNLTEELEEEDDKEVKKLIRARIKNLLEEKAGLEEELDIAKRQTMQWVDAMEALEEFKKWCRTIHIRIASGEEICYKEKRNAVDRLGIKITIYPFEVHPRWTLTASPPEIVEHLSPLHQNGHTHVKHDGKDIDTGI